MLRDKRGISAVLVTVLIILISIVAVGIAWLTIRGGLEQTTEQAGTMQECLLLNLEIESAEFSAGSVAVRVHRATGQADLSGIRFLVDGEIVEPAESEWPDELETKTYTLASEEKPAKIEIAGLLTGEKGDRLCGIADTIEGEEIQ